MSDDLENLAKDDLIEVINELQRELLDKQKDIDDKENEIQDLTQEIERLTFSNDSKGNRRSSMDTGGDNDAATYMAENEELRSKQEQDQIEINKLKDQLSEANARYTVLSNEKIASDTRNKSLNNRINELEREIVEMSSKSRSAVQQSQDFNKLKNATVKETKRLFEENEILQEENRRLNESIKKLEDDKALLEEIVQKISSEKEELESNKENHDIIKDDMQTKVNDLEYQLDQLHQKFQIAQDAEAEWENQIDILKRDFEQKLRHNEE
eukprot:gene17755-23355_t